MLIQIAFYCNFALSKKSLPDCLKPDSFHENPGLVEDVFVVKVESDEMNELCNKNSLESSNKPIPKFTFKNNYTTAMKVATDKNKPHKMVLFEMKKPENKKTISEGVKIDKEIKEKQSKVDTANEVFKIAKGLLELANSEVEKTLEKKEELERKKRKIVGVPVEVESCGQSGEICISKNSE